MTIAELLAWATQEVRLAEALRQVAESLPEEVRDEALRQAELSIKRSQWLDQQVAYTLEQRDGDERT